MRSANQSAIRVQSVTRCFGELVAVHDLSFSVDKGEIFGLLGPNGAGKTTALNLITGILVPSAGSVQVLGVDPQKKPRWVHQRIGYVPQETNVYQDLNALDNMWHHAALYCRDLSTVKDQIERLLRLVSLWGRRHDQVRTYSGGMKRRLALARSLLHDPEIIFFDEPTLGVDVQGKHDLWLHVKKQQAQGKTFIVSTNNMAEAEALCDQLIIIDHGKEIAMGSPDSLRSDLGRDIVTMRTKPAISDPELLLDGLDACEITFPEPDLMRVKVSEAEHIIGELIKRVSAKYQLVTVRMARPSLDDVFLYHTGRALRE